MDTGETDLTPEQQALFAFYEDFMRAQARVNMLLMDWSQWINEQKDSDHLGNAAKQFAAWERGELATPPIHDGTGKPVEWSTEQIAATRAGIDNLLSHRTAYQQLVAEVGVIFLVAAFEAFLLDLITEMLIRRPELLMESEKKVPFHEIVKRDSREALIESMARREAESWVGKGLRRCVKVFVDRFNAPSSMLDDEGQLGAVVEAFARRHAILHNRGLVDLNYVQRAGDRAFSTHIGQPIETSTDHAMKLLDNFNNLASVLLTFATAVVELRAADDQSNGSD